MTKRKLPITLEEAQKLMTASDIEVEDGELYNLYKCGHIFNSDDDEGKTMYRTETRLANRTCPVCVHFQPLLIKYKRCGCGAEHIGYNQPKSLCCNKCPSARKTKMKAMHPSKSYYNKKLEDTTRWNCEKRDDCLKKYAKRYQTIPCKDCESYKIDSKWNF